MIKPPLYTLLLSGVLMFCSCVEPERSGAPERVRGGVSNPSDTTLTKNVTPETGRSNSRYRIVFLGDSITAGFGVGEPDAFPSVIQGKIDSLHLPFDVINAGISGDTSTGGTSRLDWVLQFPVSILIVELGGNDGLRGIDLNLTKKNLGEIIQRSRSRFPDIRIILAGMQVPPNLGYEYTERFRLIYTDLAREYETDLVPFILEHVGGNPDLNQSDGIHPTARGHRVVAENVWRILGPILTSFPLPDRE